MKDFKIPKLPKYDAFKIRARHQLLCYREIIYRSSNRTKVFGFSVRFQIIAIISFLFFCLLAFGAYYYYKATGNVISQTRQELQNAKNAYEDFVSEVTVLQKNSKSSKQIEQKLQKVLEEDIISKSALSSKVELKEVILQRDMARAEVEALKEQVDDIEKIFKQTKKAELELLDEVEKVSSKEIIKIKESLNSINKPLRQKGLYFNILQKAKAAGKGGPYIPDRVYNSQDKDIEKKITAVFENLNNIDAYKEGIKNVPIGKPVWSYWVSSPFGRRNDPLAGGKATHKGIDLASRTGNKIRVKAKGKVLRAGVNGGYGNFVEVDHFNGFKTKYGHLHKIYVKKGDELEIDDVLGEVGSTGRSTGPHLHYEVLYMGHEVDPLNFIKAKY